MTAMRPPRYPLTLVLRAPVLYLVIQDSSQFLACNRGEKDFPGNYNLAASRSRCRRRKMTRSSVFGHGGSSDSWDE